MSKTVEAVYENGVFKPLEPVNLKEGEHVIVQLGKTDSLELLTHMYDGLSEQEIDEIESIMLEGRGRMRHEVRA